MIDIFALLLVHGLLAIALWRMVGDDTLDHEDLASASGEDEPDQNAAKSTGR